jgi:transposase-like protein
MWWTTNQKSGINALGLKRLLGLGSYESAWTCLHRLRKAMVRLGREKLSGKVEVDETFVSARKKNTVLMAAEVRGDKIGRIRLKQAYGTSAKPLVGFVRENVEPGSEIITDGGKGYGHLGSFGYRHSPFPLIRKGREASNVMLPRVHRVAALLKRWLLGIHQGKVSAKQLGYYLDEFTFRFNRRFSEHRGMLFYRLVQQAVVTQPLPYKKLIKAR